MTTTDKQLAEAATKARRLANSQRFEDYVTALTDLGRAYLERYPLAAHEQARAGAVAYGAATEDQGEAYTSGFFDGLEHAKIEAAGQAQAVEQVAPYTHERHFALREGYEHRAEEDYFSARPKFSDSIDTRTAFSAGYVRGFDKGTELAEQRATPQPAQAERVGLTDEEIGALTNNAAVDPVAMVCSRLPGSIGWNPSLRCLPADGTLLYAKYVRPIPAFELVTMYDESPGSDAEMIEFARAVERYHGIGVKLGGAKESSNG